MSPTLRLLEVVGRALHVAVRDLIPKRWPVPTRRIRPPKSRRALCVVVGLLLLGGATTITPQGDLKDQSGQTIGRVKPDAWGGYSIYDRSGERLGTARPSPWGGFDLYDRSGRRGLEQPQRDKRR